MSKIKSEILDYDNLETTEFINKSQPLSLADLGLKLPDEGPTKVVSIRLPTNLLNQIKAYSTNNDIPYQAYIKHLLSQGLQRDNNDKKPLKKT